MSILTPNGGMAIKFREALRCNLAGHFPKILSVTGCSPIFASLRLTRRCSSKCKSCNFWKTEEHDELTTEQWKDVIRSLKEEGFFRIDFTGGDIVLRRDLFELMRFSFEIGMPVNCALNGYLIEDTIAKSLMEFNLSSVFVSLDDMSSDFSTSRGTPDAEKRVHHAIKLLKKYHNGLTRLGIATTIMKYTIDSIPHLAAYAIENDLELFFNLVHFTHYFSDTTFSKEQYELTARDREKLTETLQWLSALHERFPRIIPKPLYLKWIPGYFADYRQRHTPCYKPLLKICVEPNADVRSCCSMLPVGNLRESALGAIIGSASFIENAQKGIRKDCPGCSCHYPMSLDFNIIERMRGYF